MRIGTVEVPKNQMCSSPLFRHLRRGGTITKIIMSYSKTLLEEKQQKMNEELDFNYRESFYSGSHPWKKVCMDCKLVVTTNNLFCDSCEQRGEELFERNRGN